jgi:hypothetical protein
LGDYIKELRNFRSRGTATARLSVCLLREMIERIGFRDTGRFDRRLPRRLRQVLIVEGKAVDNKRVDREQAM